MPWPTNRVPSYRLHKPTGQAVVTLNGRDRYLGVHETPESREMYDRVIAEWMAAHRTLAAVSPAAPARPAEPAAAAGVGTGSPGGEVPVDLAVSELVLAYLRHARDYYVQDGQPTGEYGNLCLAVAPLSDLYGKSRVADFGPHALRAVRRVMIDAKLSRRVINDRVNRIRRVFKWGVREQLVGALVLIAVQAVEPLKPGRSQAREKPPVAPVSDAHVDAVLPLVRPAVRAMIQIQRLSGMRPGEVMRLRSGELDRSESVWVYRPQRHKTRHLGHERIIFLGPKAQEVIKPFLTDEPDAPLFSPAQAEAARDAERSANRKSRRTPSELRRKPKAAPKRAPGRCYSRRSYRLAIARACGEAGVPPWSPNRLRHNSGTEIRRRFGLDAARAVLGHRSSTTTEIYAERDPRQACDVMAQIG